MKHSLSSNSYLNLGSLKRSFFTTVALVTLTYWAHPCRANEGDIPFLQDSESPANSPVAQATKEPIVAPSKTSPAETPVVGAGADDRIPLALPPPPVGSGGFAVFPIASTNLSVGESAALGVLFASKLREATGGRVIAPDTAGRYSSDSADKQWVASYIKVAQYLSVEAVRLDRTTIVTATLHNQDGSVAQSEKMSATSIDDFQHVSERLVLALLTGTSIEKTRTLDNVTASEAKGSNRTFVEKVFGFKTGLVVPYSSQVELASIVGMSFNGRLEGQRYFLEFGGGFLIPASTPSYGSAEGYGGLFADVGGSYYLTQTVVSPYLGAGVMPRILSTQPANLAVYGQAGLMFFRTSSSRLYTELRVAQNLAPMEIWDNSYDFETGEGRDSNTRFWPIEFGLNVGIGW